jgi:hypothetical protein
MTLAGTHEAKGKARLRLTVSILPDDGSDTSPRELTLESRDAWCLNELLRAGMRGITASAYPGARLSHYVFCLRGQGIAIDTVSEANTGAFGGTHARYILRSRVGILCSKGLGEMGADHAALA